MKTPLKSIPEELQQLPLELNTAGNELVYTFDTQNEHTGIAELLKQLSQHGIDFKDLNSTQNSLEDIFVNLVRTH